MKKIALIFSVLFCFYACEKQGTNYGTQGESGTIFDDNNDNNNSTILGVWELVNIYNAVETVGYINPSTNQQIETNSGNFTSDFVGANFSLFWEFISDDIFIEYTNYDDIGIIGDTATYTLDGDDFLVDFNGLYETLTWKLNSINNNQMDVSWIYFNQWSSGDTLYYEEDRMDVIFNKSQLP